MRRTRTVRHGRQGRNVGRSNGQSPLDRNRRGFDHTLQRPVDQVVVAFQGELEDLRRDQFLHGLGINRRRVPIDRQVDELEVGEGCHVVLLVPQPPGQKLISHKHTGRSIRRQLRKLVVFCRRLSKVDQTPKGQAWACEVPLPMTTIPRAVTVCTDTHVLHEAVVRHSVRPIRRRHTRLQQQGTSPLENLAH